MSFRGVTSAVAILSILGIVLSFSRELVIVYYSGISIDNDIFRVAYALPSFFVNNISSAIISLLLAYAIKSKQGFISASLCFVLVMSLVSLLTFLFSDSVSLILAPGLSENNSLKVSQSIEYISVFVLFASLALPIRAFLASVGKPLYSASFQVIISLVFLFSVISLSNIVSIVDSISYSMALAFAGIIFFSLGIFCIKDKFGALAKQLTQINLDGAKYLFVGVASILLFKVLSTLPRFVERSILSFESQGAISSLEYAFILVGIPSIVISMVFTLTLLPQILKNKQSGLAPPSTFKRKHIAFSVLILLIITVFTSAYARELLQLTSNFGAFDEMGATLVSEQFSILVYSIILTSIFMCSVNVLIALQKMKVLFQVGIVKLTIRLLTLYFFYKWFAIIGIPISFLITEIIITPVVYTLALKEVKNDS